MSLPIAVEALDLEDVSLFSLNGVGVRTYCKGVVATTLSLFFVVPKTSLVVLVFL